MMTKERLTELIRRWLDRNRWFYSYNAQKSYFQMPMKSQSNVISSFRLVVDTNLVNFLRVFVILPDACRKEKMSELKVVLSDLNYGLISGNFEMNPQDGIIRYKLCAACIDLDQISDGFIADCIVRACATVDRHVGRIKEALGR